MIKANGKTRETSSGRKEKPKRLSKCEDRDVSDFRNGLLTIGPLPPCRLASLDPSKRHAPMT